MMTHEEELTQVEDLFYNWFKNVKGHDDWTDEQIMRSYCDEDVDEFRSWLLTLTSELFNK